MQCNTFHPVNKMCTLPNDVIVLFYNVDNVTPYWLKCCVSISVDFSASRTRVCLCECRGEGEERLSLTRTLLYFSNCLSIYLSIPLSIYRATRIIVFTSRSKL